MSATMEENKDVCELPSINMGPIASIYAHDYLSTYASFGNHCMLCGFDGVVKAGMKRHRPYVLITCCRCGVVVHPTCLGKRRTGFELSGAKPWSMEQTAFMQRSDPMEYERVEGSWAQRDEENDMKLPTFIDANQVEIVTSARCPCCLGVDRILSKIEMCLLGKKEVVTDRVIALVKTMRLSDPNSLSVFVDMYNAEQTRAQVTHIPPLTMPINMQEWISCIPARPTCVSCKEPSKNLVKCISCPLSIHPVCNGNEDTFQCKRCAHGQPIHEVNQPKDYDGQCYNCDKPLHHDMYPTSVITCDTCDRTMHNACVSLPEYTLAGKPLTYTCLSCTGGDLHEGKVFFQKQVQSRHFPQAQQNGILQDVQTYAGPVLTNTCSVCSMNSDRALVPCKYCTRHMHQTCSASRTPTKECICPTCEPYDVYISKNPLLKDSRDSYHLELMHLKVGKQPNQCKFTYSEPVEEDDADEQVNTIVYPMQNASAMWDDKCNMFNSTASQSKWDSMQKLAQGNVETHPSARVESQLQELGRQRKEEAWKAQLGTFEAQLQYDTRVAYRENFIAKKKAQIAEHEKETLAREKAKEKVARLKLNKKKVYTLDSESESIPDVITEERPHTPLKQPPTPPLLPVPVSYDCIPPSLATTLPYHLKTSSVDSTKTHTKKVTRSAYVCSAYTEQDMNEMCAATCGFCHKELDYDQWNLVLPVLGKDLPMPVGKVAQKDANDRGVDISHKNTVIENQPLQTIHAAPALLSTNYPPSSEWVGRYTLNMAQEDRKKLATVILDENRSTDRINLPYISNTLFHGLSPMYAEQISNFLCASDSGNVPASTETHANKVVVPPGLHPLIPAHSQLPIGPIVVKDGDGLSVHYGCAYWSPSVFQEHNYLVGQDEDLKRAARLKCSRCLGNGASLGCFVDSCPRSFHLHCATDPESGCLVDYLNFNIYCSDHWIPQIAREAHQLFDEYERDKEILNAKDVADNPCMFDGDDNNDQHDDICSGSVDTAPTTKLSIANSNTNRTKSRMNRKNANTAYKLYSYLLANQLTCTDFAMPSSQRTLHQYNHQILLPEDEKVQVQQQVPHSNTNAALLLQRQKVLQAIFDGVTKRVQNSRVFDDHRLVLKESILGPTLYPNLFASSKARTGLLLKGPSGCGKTHFIKDFLHEYGCLVVTGGDPGDISMIQAVTEAYTNIHKFVKKQVNKLEDKSLVDILSTKGEPSYKRKKQENDIETPSTLQYADNEQYKYDFDSEDEHDQSKASKQYGLDSGSKVRPAQAVVQMPEHPQHFFFGPQLTVFVRSAGDQQSRFNGETERQIRDLITLCEACAPSVLVLEELDALAPIRTHQHSQHYSSVVTTLLACLDGLRSNQGNTNTLFFVDENSAVTNLAKSCPPFERKSSVKKQAAFDDALHALFESKIRLSRITNEERYFLPPLARSSVLIGTTSRDQAIDPAVRRPGRLDLELTLDRPCTEARTDLFNVYIEGMTQHVQNITQGYTISECIDVCLQAQQLFTKSTIKRNRDHTVKKAPLSFLLTVLQKKHPNITSEAAETDFRQDVNVPYGVSVCSYSQYSQIVAKKPPGTYLEMSMLSGISSLIETLETLKACRTTITIVITHAQALLENPVMRLCFLENVRGLFRTADAPPTLITSVKNDSCLGTWEEYLLGFRATSQHFQRSIVLVMNIDKRCHPDWQEFSRAVDIEEWDDYLGE